MKLSGLGVWNLYFLVKFALFYYAVIQFDVLANAALVALLVLKFSNPLLEKLKHAIAAVVAVILLYQDSWLPPINRLTSQFDLIQDFSLGYIVELAARVINVDMLLGLFIIIVCFWYASQWLRFTTITVVGLAFISYQSTLNSSTPTESSNEVVVSQRGTYNQQTRVNQPATISQAAANGNKGDSIDQQLSNFYQQQSQLVTDFPLQSNALFDVIILNVCSMATADLNAIGVSVDQLYEDFDVVFSDFNSATSYSGPAAIRILRASCGQTSHDALFEPAPEQCYLFENLEKLGYSNQVAMNHDGHFDEFKSLIKNQGKLEEPVFQDPSLPIAQYSFDGTPIYADGAVLNSWLEQQGDNCAPCAMYYNTISLHDGNQLANSTRMSNSKSYPIRHKNLFSDIQQFIKNLEKRGRNVMLMVVPEHGAGLKGDKMQFAGLREIPSPTIVSVPAAIKFIGPDVSKFEQVKVTKSTSYFALSQLISDVMTSNFFAGGGGMTELVNGLPVAPKVAENSGTIMMYVNKRPYIQLDDGEWIAYPQR